MSIIIPAFNEITRIGPTLEKVEAFRRRQPYLLEVLVVDDCSEDGTIGVVDSFIQGKKEYRLLRNYTNLGKGESVRRGMLEARGEFLLFTDADLSAPIEEVNKLLSYMNSKELGSESFDVVIGSRRVKGCDLRIRQPFLRECSGKIFSLLVRLITLKGFLDTQCGFKLFRAQDAKNIFSRQTIPGFGFDVEILFIATKWNHRIKEAPIVWSDSAPTKVQIGRDSVQMFLDLFQIRWNDWKGRYKEGLTPLSPPPS